jgi:hypothetical protein
MSAVWPWLVLVGLGTYHGLNPAMGWLFAVALGLHRRSRAVVLASLIPIALGHALSIAIVAAIVVAAGIVIDPAPIRIVAGAALIGWALYHAFYGHHGRVRVGMQTGFAGLVLWSFLMAGAHGAGLMLVPALIPLCLAPDAVSALTAGPLPIALLAVGVHTAAMLATTGVIAVVVYEWVGVDFLRRGWINLDRIWTAALVVTGLVLLILR